MANVIVPGGMGLDPDRDAQEAANVAWAVFRQKALVFTPNSETPAGLPGDEVPPAAVFSQLAAFVLSVANGADITGLYRDEVLLAVLRVERTLFAVPYQATLVIPDAFWATPLGRACAELERRIRGDELVTLATAARQLGWSRGRVSRAVGAGRLRSVVVRDPQTGRRRRLVERDQLPLLTDVLAVPPQQRSSSDGFRDQVGLAQR